MEIPVVVEERERERVTSSPSFPPLHKILFGLFVTIGIIVYAAFNIWVYRYAKSGNVSNAPTPPPAVATPIPPAGQDLTSPDTPTPTPRPIPSGKKTFSVSSAKKTGPQFRNGTIDPYDPRAGSPQTISISIVSSKPVGTVKLTMQTDTKSKEVLMKLTGQRRSREKQRRPDLEVSTMSLQKFPFIGRICLLVGLVGLSLQRPCEITDQRTTRKLFFRLN